MQWYFIRVFGHKIPTLQSSNKARISRIIQFDVADTSSSSLSSFSEKGRVVLSPFKTHKSLDIKLIFYHDWYHNSPHFRNQYCKTTNSEKITPTTTIDEYQLRLVYAAQIMMFQMNSSSTTNSSNPIFDVDNEFYSQTFDNTYDELLTTQQ